mmetsp:Transcript_106815/g.312232  ORF Transcript_106815/g.312232 Transcript_106815/m.312232 type:complete len:224 (-) Transcript_106815:359-1030(-)
MRPRRSSPRSSRPRARPTSWRLRSSHLPAWGARTGGDPLLRKPPRPIARSSTCRASNARRPTRSMMSWRRQTRRSKTASSPTSSKMAWAGPTSSRTAPAAASPSSSRGTRSPSRPTTPRSTRAAATARGSRRESSWARPPSTSTSHTCWTRRAALRCGPAFVPRPWSAWPTPSSTPRRRAATQRSARSKIRSAVSSFSRSMTAPQRMLGAASSQWIRSTASRR